MNRKPDVVLIVVYLFLVLSGWLSIFSTSNQSGEFLLQSNYGYQLIWIASSVLIALFAYVLKTRFFWNIAQYIYILFCILLLVVIFVGTEVSGAKSWIGIGNFGIQPAEFAKYATCLFLAKYVSSAHCDLTKSNSLLRVSLLIMIPIVLILLQNDTGSALPFLFLIFALFREGLTPWLLIIGFTAILLFVLLVYFSQWTVLLIVAILFALMFLKMYKKKKYHLGMLTVFFIIAVYIFSVDMLYNKVLKTHQKERIELLFGKIEDPRGVGYNVNQAQIAIGSGGFWGKGFGNGTQTQLKYVPEQHTDFIFCTIGEEHGFLGTAYVVVLYMLLISRIIILSENNQDGYVRIYGYCIACIFFAHFAINIGMTIGLMPVIGIPLPFMSYGGSSLWAFTLMLFTFINIESKSHVWG